jgi:hypothetical protein
MKRVSAVVVTVGLMALGWAARVQAAGQGETLMVIPARHTVVQLAFDLTSLRPIKLVAYDGKPDTEKPAMHLWEPAAGEWVQIDLDRYRDGSVFPTAPDLVLLVGADRDLPTVLLDAPPWGQNVKRVPALDVKTIVNTVNETARFNGREWKWLADRYSLRLKDLNETRRRYGRYGISEMEKELKAPVPRAAEAGTEPLKPVPIETAPVTAPAPHAAAAAAPAVAAPTPESPAAHAAAVTPPKPQPPPKPIPPQDK